MSDSKVMQVVENALDDKGEHNVRGWERAGSVAGGLIMLGKGVSRGGIFGLIQIGIGGLALARGLSGHSSAKSLIQRGRDDLEQVRGKIERAGDELVNLKNNAVSATRSATVTGNDSLDTPKV